MITSLDVEREREREIEIERANFSAFRTFVRFALVWVCLIPLPLCVCEGLWLLIEAGTLWSFPLSFLFFM